MVFLVWLLIQLRERRSTPVADLARRVSHRARQRRNPRRSPRPDEQLRPVFTTQYHPVSLRSQQSGDSSDTYSYWPIHSDVSQVSQESQESQDGLGRKRTWRALSSPTWAKRTAGRDGCDSCDFCDIGWPAWERWRSHSPSGESERSHAGQPVPNRDATRSRGTETHPALQRQQVTCSVLCRTRPRTACRLAAPTTW